METPDENNKNNNRKRNRDEGDEGRCSKQASKRTYAKKKHTFAGNCYIKNKCSVAAQKTPVSSRKIKPIRRRKTAIDGYRFMDLQILEDLISSLCCPCCYKNDLHLEEQDTKKKGLASYLSIVCPCGYTKEGYTSKHVHDNASKRGMKSLR